MGTGVGVRYRAGEYGKLMPIYEYYCFVCSTGKERIRTITRRNDPVRCSSCDMPMELVISVPSVQVWNGDRPFPNLTGFGSGDMTFATKKAYHAHLKEQGVDELSTSAPNYRSHGNRVVGSWK